MKSALEIVAVLAFLLIFGCVASPVPQRQASLEVSVEQASVRVLRNGMTVCLIRTELPNVENWKLINGNTEIVVKSRGSHGPAAVERFDTKTGILKDRIMAFAIQNERPEWAQGFGE